MSSIAENSAQVRQRIADAASRAGIAPEKVMLVAVTKKKPAGAVLEALAAGLTDIGENYVQEAAEKRGQIAGGRWHLLGHLQSNKAALAVTLFDLIQSVDSVKLAAALGKHALGKNQEILIQVHLGDEETKTGLPPEMALDAAAEIAAIPRLALRGLMGIAPSGVDPRPYFQELKRLFDRLPTENRQILSMGMSGDFETAIEEGATLVRVGTAIFGAR
jgi:pyridoxal phosphate enzyme (YggS family)